MTEGEIWHLFAGFGGLVLSLVVGISAWFLNSTLHQIMVELDHMESRLEKLAERVSKIEGMLRSATL